MLSQAVSGSGYNFVSEFALDILHAFGLTKDVITKNWSESTNSGETECAESTLRSAFLTAARCHFTGCPYVRNLIQSAALTSYQ